MFSNDGKKFISQDIDKVVVWDFSSFIQLGKADQPQTNLHVAMQSKVGTSSAHTLTVLQPTITSSLHQKEEETQMTANNSVQPNKKPKIQADQPQTNFHVAVQSTVGTSSHIPMVFQP